MAHKQQQKQGGGMKATVRRSVWTLLLVMWLVSGSALFSVRAQGSGNLDLILLVDSTGSTADTDPQALRIDASRFLLDYVQAVSEAQGFIQRFAAANFNTATLDEIPWTLLQGDAGRDQLIARSSGGTDFGPALEYALRLRQEPGGAEKLAVVLFTDGAPCPATPCPQGPALETYFQGLEPTVGALRAAGAEIFVVALGDNSTEANWRALVGASHYRFVDASTDLAGVYHDFFADLLGLGTEAARALRDGESTSIMVEPYLEQLVLSIIKTDLGAQVTVTDPFGGTPLPTRGGADALHAVYAIPSPAAGRWQVRVTGGAAQVYVDRQYATLALDAPTAPQALGAQIQVTGQLFRRGVVIRDDSDLRLTVTALGAEQQPATLTLTHRTDGRYLGILTDLPAEGVYTLTLSGEWAGQPIGARQTEVVTVSLFTVPVLGLPEIQGNPVVGQALTVTLAIANAERLGPETEVFARLLRADGSTVETPALRDDGVAPDAKAGDGVYTARLTLPATAGNYRVEGVLQGVSRDGVALDAVTPQIVMEVRSSLPTPTATPTIAPTVTPEFDFPTSLKRYQWWLLGILIGGSGSVFAAVLWLRKHEKRNSMSEYYNALEDANRLANKKEWARANLKFQEALTFFERFVRNHQDKALNIFRQVYSDWLKRFKDRPEFWEIISEEAQSNNPEQLKALAESLTRTCSTHAQKVQMLNRLYDDVFSRGGKIEFLWELASIPKNPLSRLAQELKQGVDLQKNSQLTSGFFENLASVAEALPAGSGEGLASYYRLCAEFMKTSGLNKPSAEIDRALEHLKTGPQALLRVVEIVNWTLTLPSEIGSLGVERLHSKRKHLVEGKEKLHGLVLAIPESDWMLGQMERWINMVQIDIARLSAPGHLEITIASSLNPEKMEEITRNSWDIELPVRLANTGGRSLYKIEIFPRVPNTSATPTFKPEKQCVELLAPGETIIKEFNFFVNQPTDIYINAEYKEYETDDTGQEMLKLRSLIVSDPLVCVGKVSDPIQSALDNPYVPDRPLDGQEWELLAQGNAKDVITAIYDEARSVWDAWKGQVGSVEGRSQIRSKRGRIIAIRGLRRVGKTTVIGRILGELDALGVASDDNPQFQIAYIDLLSLTRSASENAIMDSVLWRAILREIVFELRDKKIDLPEKLRTEFKEVIVSSDKDTVITARDFADLLARISQATSRLPIICIDEADSFVDRRFERGDEGMANALERIGLALRDLVLREPVIVLLAHDHAQAKWEEYFYDVRDRPPSPDGVNQPIFKRIELLKDWETQKLAETGPLIWTEMALKRLVAYTGGYQALVQLLCYYLVEKGNIEFSNWQRKGEQGQPPSLLVTSADVTNAVVIINNNSDWRPFVNYLRHGFSVLERRWLIVLAANDVTDPDSGVINGIEFDEVKYIIQDSLSDKFREGSQGNIPAQANDLQELTTNLVTKEILSLIKYGSTTRIAWRVGWVYLLMRQQAKQ